MILLQAFVRELRGENTELVRVRGGGATHALPPPPFVGLLPASYPEATLEPKN